jgi:hypothetical protein
MKTHGTRIENAKNAVPNELNGNVDSDGNCSQARYRIILIAKVIAAVVAEPQLNRLNLDPDDHCCMPTGIDLRKESAGLLLEALLRR